jgi:hypothetical protein
MPPLPAYRSLFTDLTRFSSDYALDAGTTAAENWELLLDISEQIENLVNQLIVPITRTLTFDLPEARKRVNIPNLIAVTSVKTDDDQDGTYETTWAADDYLLGPNDAAPTMPWGRPYTNIKVSHKTGTTKATFPAGEDVLEIAGIWGYRQYAELSGSLLTAEVDATTTTWPVDDGTDFAEGMTLMIEDEQALLTDISTNNLTVRRALNGTTGAVHVNDSPVEIMRWPAPIERATLIQAARIAARAPFFEPFFVDSEMDTDIRLLLAAYQRIEV